MLFSLGSIVHSLIVNCCIVKKRPIFNLTFYFCSIFVFFLSFSLSISNSESPISQFFLLFLLLLSFLSLILTGVSYSKGACLTLSQGKDASSLRSEGHHTNRGLLHSSVTMMIIVHIVICFLG